MLKFLFKYNLRQSFPLTHYVIIYKTIYMYKLHNSLNHLNELHNY